MARCKVDITGIDTSRLQTLSAARMQTLFEDYQNGKTENREILVQGNLKLVLSMVQRFAYRSQDLDDLFQIGCVGLMKAIDNFDLSHHVRFSTYAVPMIVGEIKRYLRDDQTVKISRQLKEQSYRCLKAQEEYVQQHDRQPDYQYLADTLHMTLHDVHESFEALQSVVSIFEPMQGQEGDGLQLADQISDPKDETEAIRNRIAIREGLRKLSDREREIIVQRYYLSKTQTEIAKELAISQAQVSRLEKSALDCLKQEL